MAKHREEANLTLRKDAITDIINKHRFANLVNHNKTNELIINLRDLNISEDKITYYNQLSKVY